MKFDVSGQSWLRANQSLKLTEPAVNDLAARCWTDLAAADRHVRATNYRAAAVRRRQLSSGPLSLAGGGSLVYQQRISYKAII